MNPLTLAKLRLAKDEESAAVLEVIHADEITRKSQTLSGSSGSDGDGCGLGAVNDRIVVSRLSACLCASEALYKQPNGHSFSCVCPCLLTMTSSSPGNVDRSIADADRRCHHWSPMVLLDVSIWGRRWEQGMTRCSLPAFLSPLPLLDIDVELEGGADAH